MVRFGGLSRVVSAVAWNVPRATAAAVATVVVVGVPTDVIDTGFFTRMTPVRWWEPLVVAAMAVLMFAWAGIKSAPRARSSNARGVVSVFATALAVGCPVCNKVAVSLLGVSGALSVWAPVQPVIAGISLLASAGAVIARWRGARCGERGCRRTEASVTAPGAVAGYAGAIGPQSAGGVAKEGVIDHARVG